MEAKLIETEDSLNQLKKGMFEFMEQFNEMSRDKSKTEMDH